MANETELIDSTNSTLGSILTMAPIENTAGQQMALLLDTSNLPPSFDWRDRGFVTAVQNQKSCGACYAFSIAHTIEAQLFRRTGAIVSLSTQQLLDCSTDAGNHGCAGGSLRNTLRYVEQSEGMMRDQDYPYVSAVSCGRFPSNNL